MNKYFWLNVIYLVFNIYAVLAFVNDVNKSTGLQTNGAGSLMLIVLVFGAVILIHFISICFIFFTKNGTLTTITTIASSLITIPVFLFYCVMVIQTKAAKNQEVTWQKENEERERAENSPEGKQHEEFLRAVYANDSIKVKQMAEQGEKITDEDLSRAVYWCFDNDVRVSPEIFKTLIAHGADARKSPSIFTYNRFCNNFDIVKILLEAGANPLPEKDVFPLACLPQLKLLLQYGAGINSLSTVNYDSYKLLYEDVRSATPQTSRWTPIMVYLKEYPAYFEETQFLLSQKPDLKFNDENKYTLQILLKDIIEGRKIMGESVDDLIGFRKKIE